MRLRFERPEKELNAIRGGCAIVHRRAYFGIPEMGE